MFTLTLHNAKEVTLQVFTPASQMCPRTFAEGKGFGISLVFPRRILPRQGGGIVPLPGSTCEFTYLFLRRETRITKILRKGTASKNTIMRAGPKERAIQLTPMIGRIPRQTNGLRV